MTFFRISGKQMTQKTLDLYGYGTSEGVTKGNLKRGKNKFGPEDPNQREKMYRFLYDLKEGDIIKVGSLQFIRTAGKHTPSFTKAGSAGKKWYGATWYPDGTLGIHPVWTDGSRMEDDIARGVPQKSVLKSPVTTSEKKETVQKSVSEIVDYDPDQDISGMNAVYGMKGNNFTVTLFRKKSEAKSAYEKLGKIRGFQRGISTVPVGMTLGKFEDAVYKKYKPKTLQVVGDLKQEKK